MRSFKFYKSKLILSKEFLLILFIFSSCAKPFVRKAPKDQFYLYQNNIEIKNPSLSKTYKKELSQKLFLQIEDNAKIKAKQKFIFFKMLKHPFVYDSILSRLSAENMKSALFHVGYYNSNISYTSDTSRKRIIVNYIVNTGKPTQIDALQYKIKNKENSNFIKENDPNAYLKTNTIITKANVITEIGRLVDTFRNNGYYKFTTTELKVLGDTTIKALTTISEDPFEQISILAESQKQKDSPRIKLAIVFNNESDSSKFKRYTIKNIYINSDYNPGDVWNDSSLKINKTKDYTIGYHVNTVNTQLFENNITLKQGSLYKQTDYYNTLLNLNKLGIWQGIDIQFVETQDTINGLNVYINLPLSKKYGFETGLELSYSAASNTSNLIAGNLFGISGNISLLNRNLAKGAIRMTHNIRGGIELDNNIGLKRKLINSNEIGYSNSTTFPRLILASIPNAFIGKTNKNKGESFINLSTSYNTRLNLFNQQSVGASFGWSGTNRFKWRWIFSPLNLGFSNIFNQSDSFKNILTENPFLNYSYNTALFAGTSFSLFKLNSNYNHKRSLSKELSLKLNAEESGLTWGLLPYFEKYKRRYIKTDFEVKHIIKYQKSTLAFRGFAGVGIPLLGSDTNKTLPFFKQYFAGGSNSMRGWPVRGIGPGGRPLIPYESGKTIFNDRTGDIQFEINTEYRYDIAKIIPNTLTLRGAIFTDIGNIWNLNNTKLDGTADSSQISLKDFYSQLGVTAGTGFRLDFNYFVVRLDLGFRIKRPELFYIKDGWSSPNIGFHDAFNKIFSRGTNDEYKKWRYENFNFSIGIGYSF